MKIEIGKIYQNKTWKYLLPATKYHGELFRAKMSSIFKLAVGIGDEYFFTGEDRLIYILIDRLCLPHKVKNTLDWLKHQDYYVTDYPFDDLLNGRKQMIVLKLPEEMHHAYDQFIKGQYHSMYTPDQIAFLFQDKEAENYKVLTRDKEMYNIFAEKIKRSFGTEVTQEDLIGAELDFPIEKQKEIFNYGK